MYVVTHNDQVILTPINFSPRYIASVIQDELDLDEAPRITSTDESRVPFEILPNVMIRKVNEVKEVINPKFETFDGPFWTFTPEIGTATYTKRDKPLDLIKKELKEVLATTRYNKEIAGVKTTIQGLEVTVDTARGSRDVFVQQFLLMGDTDTVQWKFPEGWLTLNKSELGQAVSAGVIHVQGAFVWEAQKISEIDSADSITSLSLLELE
jgi:hypothetical protein